MRLEDSPEAEDQVAFADVILLNKVDLVSPEELKQVHREIRAINPYARVIETERCGVDIGEILNRGAFDLQRILSVEPDFLAGDHHHHDENVTSVSLRAGDLDAQKFMTWINIVTQEQGANILRLKGILSFVDDPDRYVVQGVHMLIEGDHQREWRDGEKRESRIVFIGRDLDFDKIRKGFEACVA